MMLYVDDMFKFPMGNFRGMRMSHLIADDVDELHAFAKKIGLRRSWFQRSPSGDHYDVSMSYRKRAVEAGAHEISMRELAAICWCQRAGIRYSSPWRALYQLMVHYLVETGGHDGPTEEIRAVARARTRSYRERANDGRRVSSAEPSVAPVSSTIPRRIPRRPQPARDTEGCIVRRRPSAKVRDKLHQSLSSRS